MEKTNYVIVPFVNCWDNTKDTVEDLLAQTIPVTVLLVDNGSDLAVWQEARRWAGVMGGRVLPWRHNPPLPSLAATWNTALWFVWNSGGEAAMVCNNDIRVKPWIFDTLLRYRSHNASLFISAVGVTPDQYIASTPPQLLSKDKGGPDFSCYLITKEGHEKYPFDPNFIPAYCEDVDVHRRYMLGGDGGRIFSVNLPYLHKDGGSGTLKSFSPSRREQFNKAVEQGSRRHYRAKWGGGANEETYLAPFGDVRNIAPGQSYPFCEEGCITTPQLQAHGCGGSKHATKA